MGEIPKAEPAETEKQKERRSYYYDDAHGYEDFVDDDEDEDETDESVLNDREDVS